MPVHVPIRDRIIAILDEGEKLWVVQSRGVVLLFHFIDSKYSFIESFTLKESSAVFYSASIIRNSLNVLEIVFGTIFSGILVTRLSEVDFKVIQSLDGHKGSIFDIKHHPKYPEILISCSDDRSVRVWKRKALEYEIETVFLGHEARVWSLDVQGDIVASVSEDNSCRLWSLSFRKLIQVIEGDSFSKSIWTVSLNLTANAVAFGSNDGSVLFHDLDKQARVIHKDYCLSPEMFGNIKNMVTCPNGTCFVATDKDKLVKITSDSAVLIGDIKGISKLPAMSFCDGILYIADDFGCLHSFDGSNVSRISVIELSEKISRVFSHRDSLLLETIKNEIYFYNMKSFEHYKIELEKGLKVTSFFESDPFVYIGTRHGILLIFKDKSLVKSVKISEGESLKSIKASCKDRAGLSVLDRSGVETVLGGLDFQIIGRNRIGRGTIESYFGSSLVSSFHQHSFIVSDPEFGIIDKIYCGGGHRLWDSAFNEDSFSFAFMINGKLSVSSGRLDKVKSFSKRSHGKEIRCSHSIDGNIFVSGSEDGLLLISGKELSFKAETRLINTSIKCLTSAQISATDHFLFIGGSNESIEVYKLDSSGSDFKLIHFATCPKQIENIETRVLCLDVRKTGNQFILLAGYSDASMRIFGFSAQTSIFTLLNSLTNAHSKRCVQQIRFITEISESSGGFKFISAGADGLVQAWQQEFLELWNCKVHESGVNAVDTSNSEILTGGEDGSISLIKLTTIDNNIESMKIIEEAHNSAVTGVKFLGNSIVSASVDRFVNFYDEKMELKQRKRTVISDISSVSIADERLIVYGAGVESIRIGPE